MKKAVRVISVAMLMVLVLTAFACGKKEEAAPASEVVTAGGGSVEDLYGTWKGVGEEISTVSFTNSGLYRDDAGDGLYIAGTYTVDVASQTITVNESDYGMVFVYSYSVKGNTLTLQVDGGKQRIFVKQVQ
jgi:hypothetical protein